MDESRCFLDFFKSDDSGDLAKAGDLSESWEFGGSSGSPKDSEKESPGISSSSSESWDYVGHHRSLLHRQETKKDFINKTNKRNTFPIETVFESS